MRPYCGPSALAVIIKTDPDTIAKVILETRGYGKSVRGMFWREMEDTLTQFGVKHVELPHIRPKPTLARWLKIQKRDMRPYLVFISNHFIVVKGRKIYDNQFMKGVFLRKYPHRRTRVDRVCVCG